jgi:hypothetical protein
MCIWCVLFVTAGCATGRDAMTPEQQEASLKLAAEQYWNARIGGKFETAYAVEDKEGLPDFADYRLKASQIMKLNPQDFTIGKIMIDGHRGVVTVRFSLLLPNIAKPAPKLIQDEWVYQKGKWLHRFPD